MEKTNTLEVPCVNIDSFVTGNSPDLEEAKKLVDSLHRYGVVAIRDTRVNFDTNSNFISFMEKYFESRSSMYYEDGLPALKEARPDSGFQIGVTPERIERAKDHSKTIQTLFPD